MTIHLSATLEERVKRDAEKAGYSSLQEYVEDRLLAAGDMHQPLSSADLATERELLEQAWQESERGEVFTEEEVWQHLEEVKAAFLKNRSAA